MDKTLDKLYRSRFYTKRGPGDVIAEKHQKVAAEISAQVRKKIKFDTYQYRKGAGSLNFYSKCVTKVQST